MLTAAARRAGTAKDLDRVTSRADLAALGFGPDHLAAQLRAGRWQLCGTAVVLHNTGLTPDERRQVALINCGPRAVLTSFTAADEWGLRGWLRTEIHVLAPAGTTRPRLRGLVLHRSGDWAGADIVRGRRLHRLAPALVIAAGSFSTPRPGCGLFAAAVQQRLLRVEDLRHAIDAAPRIRHRAALRSALADVEQGAEAFSEIDFGRPVADTGCPRQPDRPFEFSPTAAGDTSTWNGDCPTVELLRPRSTARYTSRRGAGTTTNYDRTSSSSAAQWSSDSPASSSDTNQNWSPLNSGVPWDSKQS